MIPLKAGQINGIVGGTLYGDPDVTVKNVVTDSRQSENGSMFVAIKGERVDGADFVKSLEGKASLALTHRYDEVSYPIIVVDDPVIALGRLAKYYMENIARPEVVVSLTGSVGKTTTKEMTSAVLERRYKTARTKGNLNSHIGTPITLLSVEEDDEALVCEMGMSHKGDVSYLADMVKSDIAMITNIGFAHIENLGSREAIRDAKLEITEGLKKDGTLIINGDEPLLEDVKGKVVRVGLTEGLDVFATDVEINDMGAEYTLHLFGKTDRITLPCNGKHNVLNSLFAVAAGHLLGIPLKEIKKGLLNYKTVGLRQNIYEKSDVRVIADCYNAGLESMSASLTLLGDIKTDGKRIAVLGDMLELGEVSEKIHTAVGEKTAECNVDLLLTFGERARSINSKAKELGIEAYHYETKNDLALALNGKMSKGDTVLFKASRGMKFEEIIALAGLEK